MKQKQIFNDWQEVELINVINCIESGSRPKGGISGIIEGIPSIGGEHINKFGGFNFANLKLVSEEFYNEQKRGHIKLGDVLVVKDGATTGKVSLVSENNFTFRKALVNEHVFILRPNLNKVLPKFLFYYLYSPKGQRQILNNFHGSAQGGINTQFVKNVKIPLPSLTTQKKIVSILEKAEKLKQKRGEADKLTSEYLQSVFYDMFLKKGFPEEKLNNIVSPKKNSLKRGPFGGSLKKEIFVKKGFKVYEQQNAIYNNITLGNYYITQEKYNEMIDFAVKPGDFIISCSGTMGKISIIPKNAPEGIINQALLKITLDNKKIDKLYFKFFFQSNLIQDHLFNISHGSGINNFPPMSFIRNLQIPLPPLPLQKKFALIVEQVEKLKEKQKQSKEKIDEQFNSLMQKLFNGK